MLHETTKVTIQNLLTVKSLVTLMLTVVFAALSIIGKIDGKDFPNRCSLLFWHTVSES